MQEFMKKTFITILLVVYVAAGIGFGSMQHFCLLTQITTSADGNECCFVDSEHGYGADCQFPQKTATPTCDNKMATHVAQQGNTTALTTSCCEIQYIYQQLESASLVLSVDLPDAANKSCGEIKLYSQSSPRFYVGDVTIFVDPSTQLNLPLLI